MKVKSNTLVKLLVPSVLTIAILIGIKSCGQTNKQTSSTANIDQSLQSLDADELKALGIEGDTPEDTLRTLVGTLKKVRDKQNMLDEQNQKLIAENEHLRTKSQDISGQINAAVNEVREEADRKQQALQAEQQTLMSRLESLGNSFSLGNKPTNSSSDIPIGLGLDQQRESSVSYKGGVNWVEPQDTLPVDPNNNTGGYPAKPTYPMSFLEDNEVTRQKAELDRVAKNQRTIDSTADKESVEPAYTLPENSTLVGSQAMTALLGRVPIDGKVIDPYPFKVVIGKNNLTANGIDLPDVEGAVISGTASGDWTLSCVRGDITSITFVFADGTIRTVPQSSSSTDGSNNSGRNNGGAIGWLSDENGIPCISGERKTNAGTYLPTLFALTAAASAGDAFSQNQHTTQTNGSGGITSALTGDAGQAALGRAVGGGFKDVADWVKSRYGQTFDAVYVPPGKTVAIHITRQIPIDYEGKGRKVNYGFSLADDMENELD
ncbi:TIGR03752 family integrating conjugative element protein [Xenorhabdus nematophila]|uniref:TIGR03752 family integrating conjugative element protein n=1 Tax=Xenorhabdus nematophila TaxID=628 RepID=UPI0003275DCA|nr:TIGR03752 family integrating conjugative element protein [Xenorhabdus nematophila]CCW28979.1 conserved hypothetical protein [Xenorhabdus nematophila F1]